MMRPWEVIVIVFLLWLLIGAARGSQEQAEYIEERIDPCVHTQTCL